MLLAVVLITVVLVAGFWINELFSFRKAVTGVLTDPNFGRISFFDSPHFPETKNIRGVFLGFERSRKKIGEYEFINKAVFAGVNEKGNIFFYRTPLALRADDGTYYRPAQFWENSPPSLDPEMVRSAHDMVLDDWRKLKQGSVYTFLFSASADSFFPLYDGGDLTVFESKELEKVYKITKRYAEQYVGDFTTIWSETVTPWRTYDVIEMGKGRVDPKAIVKVPFVIRIWYLTNLARRTDAN